MLESKLSIKKKLLIIGIYSILISIFLIPTFVHAKKTFADAQKSLTTVSGKTGIEEQNIPTLLGNLTANILKLSGLIFFILAVYAGVIWMTARGNEEKITKARNTLIASVIGLVILVSAYAITNFVQKNIIEKSDNTNNQLIQQVIQQDSGQKPGCCLDWVNTISDPAARWTTQSDCKKFGEMQDDVDIYCTNGPKDNCWQWFAESDNMSNLTACIKKSASY